MSALWVVAQALWTVGFMLSMAEILGSPRKIQCDCRTGWMAERHLRAVWLLIIGVTYVVSNVLTVINGGKLPLVAAVGAYYLWRWWRHSKDSRKKLKDKVLGVVRETSAGLKVVPVGGEAR